MRRSVGVSKGEEVRNERDLPAADNRERLRLKAAVRASEAWSRRLESNHRPAIYELD